MIDNYPKPQGIANKIVTELPCSDYIECGSIGLKNFKVAENSAHLFVKNVTVRDWDVAPGDLILSEAEVVCMTSISTLFCMKERLRKMMV